MRNLRLVIVGVLIAALLVPSVVLAQDPPWIFTADAHIFYDAGENTLWVEVWCDPNDYPATTSIYFQYRRVGDADWIAGAAPVLCDGLTMRWFQTTVPVAEYYDVRAVAVYNASFVYGDEIRLYSPTPESPYVSTGQALWTSNTTARVTVYGNPGSLAWANLYVQYREQGETTWDETHKEYITAWATRTFDLTGLDILVNTEVRAALDYSTATIYGETRLIEDTSGVGVECETEPSGTGAALDPYIITNLCELNWVRNNLTAYYELANNIDASATVYWDDGEGWIPIGFEVTGDFGVTAFTGSFDGQGYSISGLYINRSLARDGLPEWTHYAGLFAALGEASSVKDLLVTDADFTITTDGTRSAVLAGILAGYIRGTALRCMTSGSVSSTADELYAHSGAGGFVGAIRGATIDQCFSTAAVTAVTTDGWTHAGGFAGYLDYDSKVFDCYARGAVFTSNPTVPEREDAGGFIGWRSIYNTDSVEVRRCYSTGAVTSSSSYAGGFLGRHDGGGVTVWTDNFWDIQTSGQATSARGTGKTTAEMKDILTFTDIATVGLDNPWDFVTIWGISSGINDGYPHLLGAPHELEVDTNEPYWIGGTEIIAEGNITATDPNATTRGFVYLQGDVGDPTLADDWVQETGDFGTGVFRISITGLTPETDYRVRAFAYNGILFVYGDTITVRTVAGPVVITNEAEHMSWQTWRGRRLHGFLQDDGDSDCKVRFEYGLVSTALDRTTSWKEWYPSGCPRRGYQSGDEFYADISIASWEAEYGQTWYFRAHAINADDEEAYGEVRSFTLGEEEEDLPLQVVTHEATGRTPTTVLANGAITAADPAAHTRGFCYLTGGTGIPTVADDTVEDNGAGSYGVGSFSLLITGLTGGNEYRVRAYAESDWGLVYGNTVTVSAIGIPVVATKTATDIADTSFRARGEVLETGATVTTRGFVYIEGITGTPTLADTVVDESGSWNIGMFSLPITGLTGGTYYRVRAFATNSIGTGYGSTITVRTYGDPDVQTNPATNIGYTTARLRGEIVDDGGDICQWRFQWGEATGVYTEETTWTGALPSGGAFYADITGLEPDTTYYFRAQARNAVGLASGDEEEFTTEDTIGAPSNLQATPLSGTEIALTWTKGGGSDNTIIQYQQSSYPATQEHGETAYFGPEQAYTLTGLTPGTTYYFRAWGESTGNFTANYTSDMATTFAGPVGPDIPDEEEPTDWFVDPDPSGLENMPLYNEINNAFDSYGLPHATGWSMLILLLAALLGMLVLVLTNGNIWLAMATGGAVLMGGAWIGLASLWIFLIYLVCVGGYAFIRSRV